MVNDRHENTTKEEKKKQDSKHTIFVSLMQLTPYLA